MKAQLALDALERGIRQRFYSESQARDARGRFGGDSAEGKSAEKAKRADSHAKAAAYHDRAAAALKGVTVKGNVSLEMGHRQAAAAHRNAIDAKGFGKDREYQSTRSAQEQSRLAHEYTRMGK